MKYDLIVCIEVLEHMLRDEAEKAIENFCANSEEVLFSSTPFDYKEPSHINVQPPEHWSELFAKHGFFRDVDFDASVITPWAVRYQRTGTPLSRLVRAYERKFFLLWKENLDLRSQALEMQNELAALERQLGELKKSSSDLEQQTEQARAELHAIVNSRGWRLLNILYRIRLTIAPQDSRRERLLFPRR